MWSKPPSTTTPHQHQGFGNFILTVAWQETRRSEREEKEHGEHMDFNVRVYIFIHFFYFLIITMGGMKDGGDYRGTISGEMK